MGWHSLAGQPSAIVNKFLLLSSSFVWARSMEASIWVHCNSSISGIVVRRVMIAMVIQGGSTLGSTFVFSGVTLVEKTVREIPLLARSWIPLSFVLVLVANANKSKSLSRLNTMRRSRKCYCCCYACCNTRSESSQRAPQKNANRNEQSSGLYTFIEILAGLLERSSFAMIGSCMMIFESFRKVTLESDNFWHAPARSFAPGHYW